MSRWLGGLWLAAVLPLLAMAPSEKFHELCGVCHSEIAQDLVTHPHFENGLDCDTCHGESARHRRAEGHAAPDRVVAPDEIPTFCGACHPGDGRETILGQFQSSQHGVVLAAKTTVRAPHCGTCHGVHRVRPPRGIELQCKRCHDSLPSACAGEPLRSSPVSCASCHEPHRFSPKGIVRP